MSTRKDLSENELLGAFSIDDLSAEIIKVVEKRGNDRRTTIEMLKKPVRKIEFEEPVFDKELIVNFRKKILKKSKNFELVWKQDNNSLIIKSLKTGSNILEINYETNETFASNECSFDESFFKEKLKAFDPIDDILECKYTSKFYDNLHKFSQALGPKSIIKANTQLVVKNMFHALHIEDFDCDEAFKMQQEYLNHYTETVSYYLSHLATITYNENIIKHAVKHINLKDIRMSQNYKELYKRLTIINDTVTYAELEYANCHLQKFQRVLKEFKKVYNKWEEKLEEIYNKTRSQDTTNYQDKTNGVISHLGKLFL